MFRPSIIDYIDALNCPDGLFRSLADIAVERDVYGEPLFRAGNSAAVFNYRTPSGGQRFLKCYIRPNPHLRTVYDYVEHSPSPLLPRVRLLPDELWIHTRSGSAGRVDVVEGEWIPGDTLTSTVIRAARSGDKARLASLADSFDSLAASLLDEEWAHGDLKPDNIIVRENALALIDCDAMWIPALNGRKAAESGTPGWRDPDRTADRFDKRMDDYSIRLISERLHATAASPELYLRLFVEL